MNHNDMKHSTWLVVQMVVLLAVGITAESPAQIAETDRLLHGETWKQQLLEEVLPAWEQHARDPADGQFYAFLNRRWTPSQETVKYPGMLARHLFSYSAAYLLSGSEHYLNEADRLYDYLKKHGWDESHGGWYYAIDREGQPADTKKDLFMNIYAATGLSLYYFVTHDPEVLEKIESTRKLLQEHAWDEDHSGYYRRLNRSWEVTDSSKVFTPQMAPVSGYLLYLYGATRDKQYLDQSSTLVVLALEKLKDEKTGWIREKFNPDWSVPKENDREREQINIGHNIEVAWMLYRLHNLTDNRKYLQAAGELDRKLVETAYDQHSGAWLHKMNLTDPDVHPDTTPWWIQAYGNMEQLYRYRLTGDPAALDRFKSGVNFWNRAFMDSSYGATVLSATHGGEIDRGDKAVRTKTSYHAAEHALLNYLYLTLWVQEEPAVLYLRNRSESATERCVNLLDDPSVNVERLEIDGRPVPVEPGSNPGCIRIPGGNNQNFKVVLSQ